MMFVSALFHFIVALFLLDRANFPVSLLVCFSFFKNISPFAAFPDFTYPNFDCGLLLN
jgi:hypothetical protein